MAKHAELKAITDKQFLYLEKLLVDVNSKNVPVRILTLHIFVYLTSFRTPIFIQFFISVEKFEKRIGGISWKKCLC